MNKKDEKKAAKYFAERIYFWQKALGLTWMQIQVDTTDVNETVDYFANYEYASASGSVLIKINREVLGHDKIDLDEYAFHEVFEMGYLGRLRSWSAESMAPRKIERETHRVVRAAENTIFEVLRHQEL